MYLYAAERLEQLGYARYEISNFARPGRESRHNLRYWRLEEYLGFGPGAHSDFGGVRFAWSRDLEGYIRTAATGDPSPAERQIVSPEERAAAMEADAFINPEAIRSTMTEYYQQIVGGDAIICLLSPYMYEMVHESDGFLPLAEIYTEIPEAVAAAAYDDCGLVLAKTAFGQSFNGIDDLPEDTILCIRRLSSMAKLKGEAKTQKRHAASIELFRRLAEYTPEAAAEKESN